MNRQALRTLWRYMTLKETDTALTPLAFTVWVLLLLFCSCFTYLVYKIAA